MTRARATEVLADFLAGTHLDKAGTAPASLLASSFDLESSVDSEVSTPEDGSDAGSLSDLDSMTDEFPDKHAFDMPKTPEFVRCSNTDLRMIANLPPEANVLLLTPVIEHRNWRAKDSTSVTKFSGSVKKIRGYSHIIHHPDRNMQRSRGLGERECCEHSTYDPFEDLGRSISLYHKRVRHVPFVPAVGLTDTHRAFILQANAVITVICEPAAPSSSSLEQNLSNQLTFASKVCQAITDKNIRGAKERLLSKRCIEVLIQCVSASHRFPIPKEDFDNVLEVSEYNDDTAKRLAENVFQCKK